MISSPPSSDSLLAVEDRQLSSVIMPRTFGELRLVWLTLVCHGGLKGLSHLVQSCLLYRSCMSKDSARSTGHVDHFFPLKYCVDCKKLTLKVLINLGFVTSFEDSHYILLFRYIYGAQLTQWFCYSKHLHVNRNYRPNGTATSLSPKCYSANVPLDFCTTADFEMKYLFNEGTAGVLGNT